VQPTITTDLNYAALLIVLGAEVDGVNDCGRYAKITLSIPDSALQRANDKTQRLARLVERCESVDELAVAYEQSMLAAVSDAYYQLKRRVAKARQK
jgi:hypothetical protein